MSESTQAKPARRQRPTLPTLAELDELSAVVTMPAPPEWEDLNGHVNVTHHYGFHFKILHKSFQNLGIDGDYINQHGLSTFTVEQHLSFYSEVLIGQEVSGHFRLLDRNSKLLHGICFMANRETGQIASVIEFIEAHVDLKTRRTAGWHPDLAEIVDGVLTNHRQLSWEAPLSGSMGLR